MGRSTESSRRRGPLTYAVASVLIAGVLVGSSWALSTNRVGSRPTDTQLAVRQRVLRPGDSVPVRDLRSLAMENERLGFAVAVIAKDPWSTGRTYLVTSSNGGSTWRVIGHLPRRLDGPNSTTTLDAASNGDLYYHYYTRRDHLSVSSNRGTTWRDLVVPGDLQSFHVVGSRVWVVADQCVVRHQVATCRSYLLSFSVGSTHSETNHVVPGSVSRFVSLPTWQNVHVNAASVTSIYDNGSVVLSKNAGQMGLTTMVATNDGGRTWRRLNTPCSGLISSGLFTTVTSRWVQYCSLDGGMNQGTNMIFTSSNEGRSWHLIAAQNEDNSLHVGRMGDGMSSAFAQSINGRYLWQVSTVGPMAESSDGGVTWAPAPGYPQAVNPIGVQDMGAQGAWILDAGTSILMTSDGVHWREIG